MISKLRITAGDVCFEAVLRESVTVAKLIDALPITGQAQRWGGEIYFSIPVKADVEPDRRDLLEAGEIVFWPPGNAFCIFFGATPASGGEEIRAASNVNILGKIEGDLSKLWDVQNGEKVILEAVD